MAIDYRTETSRVAWPTGPLLAWPRFKTASVATKLQAGRNVDEETTDYYYYYYYYPGTLSLISLYLARSHPRLSCPTGFPSRPAVGTKL